MELAMSDIDIVSVTFAGKRRVNCRVHVYVDGSQYNGQGYVFGPGISQQMTRAEAKVLTGETKPDIADDGEVTTGFIVDGDLGGDGLTGEAYEISEAESSVFNPLSDIQTENAAPSVHRKAAKRLVGG